MRSPGVIYRRYRQLRRKILHEKIIESRKKEHKNCFYGKILEVSKNGETRLIKLCSLTSFHPEINENFELCTCPEECNAFITKYEKDKVEEDFEKMLLNPKRLVQEHPDLAVFQWILDKPLTDEVKEPTWFNKILIYIIHLLEEIIKITGNHQEKLT